MQRRARILPECLFASRDLQLQIVVFIPAGPVYARRERGDAAEMRTGGLAGFHDRIGADDKTCRRLELSDQEVLKRLSADQPRDKAVRRGLEYLRKQQKPDGATSERYPTALTAMSVMAHFAAGHPPADKQYGPWLRKSINYVISKQNPDGYFGEADGSRMYGHGIATLIVDKNYRAVTAISDRNVILVKGRVVFEGDSPTLLAQPDLLHGHLGV